MIDSKDKLKYMEVLAGSIRVAIAFSEKDPFAVDLFSTTPIKKRKKQTKPNAFALPLVAHASLYSLSFCSFFG